MESTRQHKVARLLQRELGDIFQKNGKAWFPGKLISVTVVRISADLGVARVYLGIFPLKEDENILGDINVHNKEIRYELGKRIKNQVRKIPELSFFRDDSLDYAEKIDNLLTIIVSVFLSIVLGIVFIKDGIFLLKPTSIQFSSALNIRMSWVYLSIPVAGVLIVTNYLRKLWMILFKKNRNIYN